MILLIQATNRFFDVVTFMLFARVILSWFPMALNNKFGHLLFMLTEPILMPVRRLIQRSPLGGPGMVIDFSVIFTFLLISVLRSFITAFLFSLM